MSFLAPGFLIAPENENENERRQKRQDHLHITSWRESKFGVTNVFHVLSIGGGTVLAKQSFLIVIVSVHFSLSEWVK